VKINTELFRNSIDEPPSIEATYYAVEFLSKFGENDLSWMNTINLRTTIKDHLTRSYFQFEDLDIYSSQLFAGSILKYISFTVPFKTICDHMKAKLVSDLQSEKGLSLKQIYYAVRALRIFGDESIPPAIFDYIKITNQLEDLFYIVNILIEGGIISKFFDIDVKANSFEGSYIDIEKEGVNIQANIKPAVRITSFGRFIIINMNVNASLSIAGEHPFTEILQPDYQTGFYTSQRFSPVLKLGHLSVNVLAYSQNPFESQIIVQKYFLSHISLPIEISCEASSGSDESIPLSGIVSFETNFKIKLAASNDVGIEVEETTLVVFSAYDAAGTTLAYQGKQFESHLEFSWDLPSIPLPSETIKIEIGDQKNGIHTEKEFKYKVISEMVAHDVQIPKDLKLHDLIKITIIPGILSKNEFIPFSSESTLEGSYKDASGETFSPMTSQESQRYLMDIKTGGFVTKEVEGEIEVEDGQLTVYFESSVEDSLDYATGFSVAFYFIGEDGTKVLLQTESDISIEIKTRIISEGTILSQKEINYGETISTALKLKDQDGGKYLSSKKAYPVILVKQNDTIVSEFKYVSHHDNQYHFKFLIGADLLNGDLDFQVAIHKGSKNVLVYSSKDNLSVKSVRLIGKPQFKYDIHESGKFVIVDLNTSSNGKNLGGSSLECKVYSKNGQVVSKLLLSQQEWGNRLSWNPNNLTGEYDLHIHRVGSNDSEPLVKIPISIDRGYFSIVSQLPFEEFL
jgi:hypothetical protein